MSTQPSIDVHFLHQQREWNLNTFGPGPRTEGIIDHIKRELEEVSAAPDDVTEWADVILLALAGAMRAGHGPGAVVRAVRDKQALNEQRTWPDWRTQDPTKAILHETNLAGPPIYPPLTEEEFNVGSILMEGVPLSETEHGDHVFGWGHHDKDEFAAAVNAFALEMAGEEPSYSASDVRHCRAVTIAPASSPEGWWINWSKEHQEHPLSFPLTLVDR